MAIFSVTSDNSDHELESSPIFKVIILIKAPTKLHKDFDSNVLSPVLMQRKKISKAQHDKTK